MQDLAVSDIREVQLRIARRGVNNFLTHLGVLSECDNSYSDVLRIVFKNKDNTSNISVTYCRKKAKCDTGEAIFK